MDSQEKNLMAGDIAGGEEETGGGKEAAERIRTPRTKGDRIMYAPTGRITADQIKRLIMPMEEVEQEAVTNSILRNMTVDMSRENFFKGAKRAEKEKTLSMWDYDRRCLPEELASVAPKTFLTDPYWPNLCFFDRDLLKKISKLLDPLDFVNLSLTCRFLHWRLFTFTTCYAPYTVRIDIFDKDLAQGFEYEVVPKTVYYYESEYEHGHRGLFVHQPACLKRPFVFDTIEVGFAGVLYKEEDYDRCLPYILPVRKYATNLKADFTSNSRYGLDDEDLFSHETDNFLRAIEATSLSADGGVELQL